MGFLGDASGLSKVACLILFLAFGVHCVGYATTSWMKYEKLTSSLSFVIGLWRMDNCSGYHKAPCIQGPIPDSYSTTLLTVTQALESCFLILLLISAITSAFYVASPSVRVQRTAVAILVLGLLSALFAGGGLVSFIFNLPDKHYVFWSLGLSLVATALAILAAILMVPDIRAYDYHRIQMEVKRAKRKIRRKMKAEERAAQVTKV